jgi:argininosuccinate lyase
MKMWSGRFRQPLDPEFDQWQRSFPFDQRLLGYELEASRAHARALQQAGVLSSEELASILFGLDQIGEQAGSAESFLQDTEAEDIHHFVEKHLIALIGDSGFKLHTGRSRNEQIATNLRLYVRDAIDRLQKLLGQWAEALLARAEEAGGAVMPAYTHLQRAEPVLAAHWLLAYVEMFQRDSERLADCRKRVNLCPLGSGAVAGATLALDRSAIAADLGFDGATANSMDATSDRDFALEFVNALSMLAIHLSGWAEEMILFSTQEFGFLHLPETFSTGSSAMPQKKNPDLLELVRGKCARVAGDATALVTAAKGLPLAYNKDLQETQEPLFDASNTVLSLMPLATRWMIEVEFDFARMQSAAQSGFLNAWAAAAYLVDRGVPARLAHEAVGKAVQISIEKGCELQDLPLAELQQLNPAFDQDFYSKLTLESVLKIHDVPGGTAPARVREAIAAAKERIASLREVAHARA